MRQHFAGPTLPKELRDQVGAPANRTRTRQHQPINRKDRRKTERAAVKQRKQQPQTVLKKPGSSGGERQAPPKSPPAPTRKPKDILKLEPTESSSPTTPRPSRATKDRLNQDDAEIAALERKLGMKGSKKRKADADNDLDQIFGDLGGLDSDEDAGMLGGTVKRKRAQDEEWLASKRQKALSHSKAEPNETCEDDPSSSELGADEFDSEGNSANEEDLMDDGDLQMDDEESEFGGFDPENDAPHGHSRVRENPFIAPVTLGSQPTKYIPPALRGPASSDSEVLARLRRQVQGLLNRLSDANMMTILRDVEQIYQSNARGYVTTVLIDLLIGLLADESLLPDPFLILHAGFITAVYKVIGPDFGAQMVERIVTEFDRHFQRPENEPGKQVTNLMTLVALLYSFQLIGSNLIFDYIKIFLEELSDLNAELLLRIVKVSGSSLRQDDPRSLKDIVVLLQKSVAKVGKDNLPVRTKFMIEAINDLKNNRMKTGFAASAVTTEHTIRTKKQLGSLNTRTLKGTEPLRIGLADIRHTDKRGKWWLVGASWRNDDLGADSLPEMSHTQAEEVDELGILEDEGEVDLFQLAREQGMNTDVRRAIFINLLSSSDQNDAHVRLAKLNLKKAQEMEIPRVIVHCVGSEETYNHFYTLVAQKVCTNHQLCKSLQFALWDVFRLLGEKKHDDADGSDDDGPAADLSSQRLANLGKFYGTLIAKKVLPITVLKNLNLAYLKPDTQGFVELILITAILESQKGRRGQRDERALQNIFIDADRATEMIAGLQYFMRKKVKKSRICLTEKEEDTVGWGCQLVTGMLERLMAATTLNEN